MKKTTIFAVIIFFSISMKGQNFNIEKFDSLKTLLLGNLKKCNEIANNINKSNDEWDIESYKSQGLKYYNLAYQNSIKIQNPKYNLESYKFSVISRALKYYSRGFRNVGSLGGPFIEERNEINKDLEGWPDKKNDTEKDFEEGIFKVKIGRSSGKAIGLPSKGTWCLWEIKDDATIWLDGYLYNNGRGRFVMGSKDLPKYLGNEKEFEIRNVSMFETTLVFKMCKLNK